MLESRFDMKAPIVVFVRTTYLYSNNSPSSFPRSPSPKSNLYFTDCDFVVSQMLWDTESTRPSCP